MKFRETAIVSGGLLVQQVTVFLTGVLIARFLGANGFGILGTLKSLSSILVIVTPLGLDLALLKHASFYHERPEELRAISRALRIVAAGLNVLLLGLVVAWIGPSLQEIYRDIPDFSKLCAITMLGIVFAADVQISGALYRVADRVVPYSLVVNYSQPVIRLGLSCLVLLAGGGVESIAWVNTIMFGCAFLALGHLDRGGRGVAAPMPLRVVAAKVKAVLSESLWMAMSLLVYQSIRLVDIIILAALTTAKVAGEYTAMSSVAQLIQIYPIAISQTLGPRIALSYERGDLPGVVAELKGYLRKASILGGYLFGGVAVFGADLDLVFGSGFSFPWLLAFLLAAGWYISALLAPFGYVLSMTGRHRRELVILSAGAALLVVCLIVLIPPFGSIGAALSVTVAFVVVNAVRCTYVVRILSRNPLGYEDLIPPACFLVAAFVCREVGAVLFDRHLLALILACLSYSTLAAGLYLALSGDAARRWALLQVRVGKGRPS